MIDFGMWMALQDLEYQIALAEQGDMDPPGPKGGMGLAILKRRFKAPFLCVCVHTQDS